MTGKAFLKIFLGKCIAIKFRQHFKTISFLEIANPKFNPNDLILFQPGTYCKYPDLIK